MSFWHSVGKISPGYQIGKALTAQPEDPGKEQLRQVLAQLAQAKTETGIGYAKAAAQQKRSIPIIKTAFDQASANGLKLADNTKAQVVANQDSELARADMAVNSTGFNNSNIGGFARRGVIGDTARALQGLDDLFTQHDNQLQVGKANALSAVDSNLADLAAAGANANASLSGKTADAITGVQHVPKKSIWDLVAPIATTAAAFA